MKRNNDPTEAELEILAVLWDKGVSTVREVNEILNQERPVGYTTTLKMMQLMTDKKMLSREKIGKTHLYKALISQTITQENIVNKLITKMFKGSPNKLIMQILGNNKTSATELKEIKDFLNKMENEGNT